MALTLSDVRTLALALPEAEEHEHWGRPSFSVRGRIFLTLWPDEERAVLKLTPEMQRELVREEPTMYAPVPQAWGLRGYTSAFLQHIASAEFAAVLETAWRQVAPKRVVAAYQAQRKDASSSP